LHWEADTGRHYGAIPDMPRILSQAATSIRIVCDEIPRDDPNFSRAHAFLARAKVVAFLGFGYQPVNLGRLQVTTLTKTAERYGTRKGMGLAEWEAARRLLGDPLLKPNFGTDTQLGTLGFLRTHNVLYDPASPA
jgi:hypothetical protein